MGRPLPLTLSATGRKLQLHRHLNQSESLPIKHSFLLVVCKAVSTSEKDPSNMA